MNHDPPLPPGDNRASLRADHEDGSVDDRVPGSSPASSKRGKKWIRMRPEEDEEAQDWWWASTAIPLLAATTGPLANVLSIAALVTSWRNNYDTQKPGIDAESKGFSDPVRYMDEISACQGD